MLSNSRQFAIGLHSIIEASRRPVDPPISMKHVQTGSELYTAADRRQTSGNPGGHQLAQERNHRNTESSSPVTATLKMHVNAAEPHATRGGMMRDVRRSCQANDMNLAGEDRCRAGPAQRMCERGIGKQKQNFSVPGSSSSSSSSDTPGVACGRIQARVDMQLLIDVSYHVLRQASASRSTTGRKMRGGALSVGSMQAALWQQLWSNTTHLPDAVHHGMCKAHRLLPRERCGACAARSPLRLGSRSATSCVHRLDEACRGADMQVKGRAAFTPGWCRQHIQMELDAGL
jgi:hypothetical protein